MSINELIKRRVSVKKYTDKVPEVDQIIDLLDQAVYAPNHKMREPWRFIILDQEGKKRLKKRFDEVITDAYRDALQLQFDNLYAAPILVAVVMPILDDIRDELEDLQACAAMIQNFMLLSVDAGLGTKWKTPHFIENDAFKEVLGLESNELVVAFVMVGYPEVTPNMKPRTPAKSKTTIYR